MNLETLQAVSAVSVAIGVVVGLVVGVFIGRESK